MASAWKLPILPHTSVTGLNMGASIHFLASIENAGYFEADVSKCNPLRDQVTSKPYEIGAYGCVLPLGEPGVGLDVDEDFLVKHPVIQGQDTSVCRDWGPPLYRTAMISLRSSNRGCTLITLEVANMVSTTDAAKAYKPRCTSTFAIAPSFTVTMSTAATNTSSMDHFPY
jgi:hypothetical protein